MMLARLFRLALEQDPFWNYPKRAIARYTIKRRYNRDGNQIKFEPGANTHSTGEMVIL